MSRTGATTLTWADGDYAFRLAWGQLIELQEACDAGPQTILMRLSGADWRVQDIAQVLRLGLVGGGYDPAAALRLVRLYVEARPPMENLLHAQAVLMAALIGAPDEPQKKSTPPE